MSTLEENNQEIVEAEDLERVFFRTQDSQGKFANVDAKEATDAQFDAWAKSRAMIAGEDTGIWSLQERVNFCNHLYLQGELVVLKKGVTREDEGEDNITLLTRTREEQP